MAQPLAHRLQIGREVIEVLDVGAPPGMASMTALIIGKAGDAMALQCLGYMTIAAGMFGNSMHDDQSGNSRVRHLLMPAMHSSHACGLVSSQMPKSTNAVPAAIHGVKGSPRMTTAIKIVDSGPIVPA